MYIMYIYVRAHIGTYITVHLSQHRGANLHAQTHIHTKQHCPKSVSLATCSQLVSPVSWQSPILPAPWSITHQWDTSQKVDSRGVEICQGFSRIKTSTLSRSLRVFWRQINGDSWWKLTHIDSWLIPPEIFGNWSARNCCCKMLELPSSTGQPWAHGWARDNQDSSQGMVKR